ncbi:hypothetical protein CFC21_047660, partial [Triticum aestivum]
DTISSKEPKIPEDQGKKKTKGTKFLPACFRGVN